MDEKICLGGIDLPIKPTPLVKMAKMMPVLQRDDIFSEEAVTALAECVFHGIRRAGGEVTQEFVSDNIDMTNITEVFGRFFKVNGMTRKDAGGAAGEAGAGAA